MCEINWSAIAIVGATLCGPILAVWASEIRQQRRQATSRKEWVFRTLMTTRSNRLSQDHVSALNHIDFAFPPNKYPQIADAWGLYRAHLNKKYPSSQEGIDRLFDEGSNLLADLIHLMASDLKIPFSKTSIKDSAYYPKGHAEKELQLNVIRILLLELLNNKRSLYIQPMSQPTGQQDMK